MDVPRARVDTIRDVHFGTTVEDPYRWMEDWRSDELRAWVDAQGEYARAYLDRLPERESLHARIAELTDASPIVTNLQIANGNALYLRRDPGENVGKLVTRTLPDGGERVLFDPASLGGDVHTVIDWYWPSRDGTLVALGLSQGGSEDSVLRVLRTDGGTLLDDAITRTRFSKVQWLVDNRSFLYHRLARHPDGAPQEDRYRDSRTFLHRLGDDPEQDEAVFGNGINARVDLAREDLPSIVLSDRSEWMVGRVFRGVQPETVLYVAPLATIHDPVTIPWHKVADVRDGVSAPPLGGTGIALDGDTLYLRTFKDAPRYKVIAVDMRRPDMSEATAVVPQSDVVIEDFRLAGNYLVTRDLDDGIGRLRHFDLGGGESQPLPLPVDGTISAWTTSEKTGEVLVQAESWIVAPQLFLCRADGNGFKNTGWLPPCRIDLSSITAHEITYPARDGTQIPLSIIHTQDLPRDGSSPAILVAYGSYGISRDPIFQPSTLAWLERGGVFAVAHVRGGGERGKEWHEGGRYLKKGTTIDDFIAAAEFLIEHGYTQATRLAGMGASAGGIPTGGALVTRPDLFSAMVMRVAVTNFLRFEFSENGVPNIPELGTVTQEDGFKALQIMDSYTKVKDGVTYPAALLTTGLNDPRVVVWQATKMAARLQAATGSGKPVLLRVESHGGHGIGSTRTQLAAEMADIFAFLLHEAEASGSIPTAASSTGATPE